MLHTDHMSIIPAYREGLSEVGLTQVEAVLTRTDGRTAAWSRTTDTVFVAQPAPGPGFYVKRYYYPCWNKRLRCTFRGTFIGTHRGQAEYRLLHEMQQLGLPAVRAVAHGARRIGHFVAACFLITEAVPGACNLTTFARQVLSGRRTLDLETRRQMVRRLAQQVAELHASGFAHGQLFWRNILVRSGPVDEPEFFFLDARPRRGGRRIARAGRWWIHELGHLAASALPFTTRSERMQFLVEYFGARRLPARIKEHIREIDGLASRWAPHEAQRIKMNDRFEEWSRQLDLEATHAGGVSDGGFAAGTPGVQG